VARGARAACAFLLALAILSSCQDDPAAQDPEGPDISTPYPIDRAPGGGTAPATYKGLPLQLAQSPQPAVTAVDGVLGVVCVGMSNARLECDALIQQLAASWKEAVNPQVKVVNCSVGSHAIERWIDPAYDATLWDDCRERRLPQAGVRPDQVRVLYHKAANQFTTGPGGSPLPLYPASGSDYDAFLANLSAFAARVLVEFPSVRAVYSSSRCYGGFAGTVGRGEPLSYEEGHALNSWLRSHPLVGGVWQGWGGYLWAPDCSSGIRNGSGVCFLRSDFQEDGVHPSAAGSAKLAGIVHARLLTQSWYRR
jgi:hypothetical protein